MYVCGVQIARRDVLKSKCSYTRTQPPHQRTEGTTGVNVVVQSETMLGTESNTE